MSPIHAPVMMQEVLNTLPLMPGATYADGTLGLAGHAFEAGKRISPGGLLVGLDWDQKMLAEASKKLSNLEGAEVKLYHSDFRSLPQYLTSACVETGRVPQADAALLDLGLNNAQIEDEARGISFRREGTLDMRMDLSSGVPASEALNKLSAKEIEDILWNFGDERWARKIAQVIVDRRRSSPLKTTSDLVDCVLAAIPAAKRDKRIHPATRTFQAIRIYINGELDGLAEAVDAIAKILAPAGVLVVLSYHSGEDRIVKNTFKQLAHEGSFEILTKKPVRPSLAEVSANPKSRSALFRAIKRTP